MSLLNIFTDHVEQRGDSPWLHFDDSSHTWADAFDASCRMAGLLREAGVDQDSRLVVMSTNRPAFLWTYLGASFLGATVVPVNPAQGRAVVHHILGDCQPQVVVYEGAEGSVVDEWAQTQSARPILIRLGAVQGRDLSVAGDVGPLDPGAMGAAAEQTIMYTSGTTGPPKGVLVRGSAGAHKPAVFDVADVGAEDILYCCLPLFHGNALFVSALGSIAVGAQLALVPRFTASGHWDHCRRFGATQFNAIGAMIPLLLKQAEREDDASHDVRVVFSSGCPPEHWEVFQERFGVRLVEWFGIVDYPGNIVNGEGIVGAIGRASGVEVRVMTNSGDEAVRGEVGELLLKSERGGTREYYRDPETTPSRPDGWFRTGDLVRRDSAGVLFYEGRKKDVIRRRGENISPWEVESVLLADPRVREAAAFAVPSDLGEDELMVAVAPIEPGAIDPEAIVHLAQAGVAAHAVPRFVDLVAELPKTETSKIKYAELRHRGVTESTWDRGESVGRGDR